MFPATRLLPTICLTTGCLIAGHAAAAPFEYIGASTGNWNDSANWSPATVPDAADADPFFDHDPSTDGSVTISVNGEFELRSFTVNLDGAPANNAPVVLGDPGGLSSLTFADGGTVTYDSNFNRNGTNLQLATDVNFQTLNLDSAGRNSGFGQTARAIVLTQGTFTGDTLNASGTVTFDGSATYDFPTFVGGTNVTMEFLGSDVDLSGTDVTIDRSLPPANGSRLSFLGVNATLGSLTISQAGGLVVPGVYTEANAANAPLAGGGTIDLTQWFLFNGNALTLVPEPGSLALASLGLLLVMRRTR